MPYRIHFCLTLYMNIRIQGFRDGSDSKESACSVGDQDLISGWEDPLEKEVATYSSILAWSIPWTEEAGGLQCKGSVTKSQTQLSDFHF